MPYKPDAPCAGGCGKLLWGGRGSLPDGERMCRPCRALHGRPCSTTGGAKQGPPRECPVCHSMFRGDKNTCSVPCGVSLRNQRPGGYRGTREPHPCARCGDPTRRYSGCCDACLPAERRARYQRSNLRRRAPSLGPILSIDEVAERDGWRCHLCSRKVDRRLTYPHPLSASRDHLVPVVDGGTNDPANLALAHLRCNISRQHRGPAQLQLFG